jgi:hypothetical protein
MALLPASGVVRPAALKVVQPSRAVMPLSALRVTLKPALAAARSHASVALSVAAAGAAWLPAALDDT